MTKTERRRALMSVKNAQPTFKKLTEFAVTGVEHQLSIPFNQEMLSCEVLWIASKDVTLSQSDYIYYDINNHRVNQNARFGYSSQSPSFQTVAICITRAVTINENQYARRCDAVFNLTGGQRVQESTFDYIGIRPYNGDTTFNAGTIEVWGWV